MKSPCTKLLAALATIALCADAVSADVQPTNDLPNPYQTTAPWGKPADGRKWVR